jgi:Protein of unknown function (DUF3467)
MSTTKISKTLSIPEAVKKAESIAQDSGIYSNYVQFSVTTNEIILDFYYLVPPISDMSSVKATHLQRVIVPHTIGKAFAKTLGNVISTYEEEQGIKFTDIVSPDETPKV